MRAPVEPDAIACDAAREPGERHARRRREGDVTTRLGQETADESRDVAHIPAHGGNRAGEAALQPGIDTPRRRRCAQIGIGVTTGNRDRVAQVVDERFGDLLMERRTKTDGILDACVDCRALVCDAGRHVQHVAGFKRRIVLRREAAQQCERRAASNREVGLPAVTPAPSAGPGSP